MTVTLNREPTADGGGSDTFVPFEPGYGGREPSPSDESGSLVRAPEGLRGLAAGVLHFVREAFPSRPEAPGNLPPLTPYPDSWGSNRRT